LKKEEEEEESGLWWRREKGNELEKINIKGNDCVIFFVCLFVFARLRCDVEEKPEDKKKKTHTHRGEPPRKSEA